MSHTLFIADLHLCQEEPAITAGFLRFLQREAPRCDALYILGDLFEAWIGDDDITPLHQQVAEALRVLPCPVFFIHGNRDFLLGQRWANASGITLLPQEKILNIYGRRLLIMHGDTLCTDDISYQRFRRTVHQRWLQKLFLTLPLWIRKRIATRMRASSQQTNQHKAIAMMDVNLPAVEHTMAQHQVTLLIHGHTHRPAIHALSVMNQPAQRAVLGAWHQRGSMIQLDQKGIQLLEFDF